MARVLRRELFAEEDVAEVPVAIRAEDLDAVAVGVALAADGAGQFVVEARPAAVTVELVGRAIKRRVALAAEERARVGALRLLADVRSLGPFVQDHAGFVRREFVELRRFHYCVPPSETIRLVMIIPIVPPRD